MQRAKLVKATPSKTYHVRKKSRQLTKVTPLPTATQASADETNQTDPGYLGHSLATISILAPHSPLQREVHSVSGRSTNQPDVQNEPDKSGSQSIVQQIAPLGGNHNISRAADSIIQRSCHTVGSKETIYGIAKKYGVTQKALLDANGMTNKDTLAIGKMLIVPDGKACTHTVTSGETLFSIGRAYNVAVADIQKANNLKGSTITPGQILTIPIAGGGATTVTPKPAAPTATKPTPAVTPATPKPAAPTPAKPTPTTTPATPTSTTPSPDPGHDPNKDYSTGTLREDSFLRKSDHKTILTADGAKLFFKTGDTVQLISAAGDWVEVEGQAYKKSKPPVAAGTNKGWIERAWTTMTLGDYKDVPVDDRTATYGKLAAGSLPKADVKSVILHQTGGSSGSSTLSGYSERIKIKSTIGAHYLIDETGKIILTVPVNKKVSHVGKTKSGFDKTASNAHAIGIEHVGAETKLDLPANAKDAATLKKNRDVLRAMTLAPALKQRLIAMTDAQLYAVARDNRDPDKTKLYWYIYGDINAAQKRSSFLLTSKLMTDFGLAEKDLLPHETVSWKNIGEGENIKEYLTARLAYPRLVSKLEALVSADATLAKDSELAKLVTAEKDTVAALIKDATAAETKALETEKAAGKPAEATAREKLRAVFYDKFWARQTQLTELVQFLKTAGATQPSELQKIVKAWVS